MVKKNDANAPEVDTNKKSLLSDNNSKFFL